MVKKRYLVKQYQIDGTPILMPDADVEITYKDLESSSSGYDESGYYHRQVIQYEKRTWKFKYAFLTESELDYMRELVRGKKDFTFHFVKESGAIETVRAYAKPASVVYQSKRSGLYKNFIFEVCEC